MFGLGWEPGQARIVARRLLSKGLINDGAQDVAIYEYALDVHPDDGSPDFRGTAKDPMNMIHWRQPEVGNVVRVQYHAKNHDVKFDRDDPSLHQDTPQGANRKEVKAAHSAEAMQQWEALTSAAPGTGAAYERPPEPPPVRGLADIPAFAALSGAGLIPHDLSDTVAAIKRARAAGDMAEVDRLKAEFNARSTQRMSFAEPAAPVGSPPAADRIERLQKLADLHDRGVLTDAEFAAEKARILNEG